MIPKKKTNQKKSKRPLYLILLAALAVAIVLLSFGCTPGKPPKMERNSTGDLVPYSNIENESAIRWGPVRAIDPRPAEIVDENHIRIQLQGVEEPTCTRYNTKVVETPETITITLFIGKLANAEKVCKPRKQIVNLPGYDTFDTVMVQTQSPIGDREILMGGGPFKYD